MFYYEKTMDEPPQKRAKMSSYDRSLNFTTSSDPEGFAMPHKRTRTTRDPMSHRIIEKRRRDRMNNCLADLSHLIPASYLKQGQGRIEKTEIIEMAIKHIKHLQALHVDRTSGGDTSAENFYMGFRECMDETMRFLVEKQNFSPADPFCIQLLKHLKEQGRKFVPITAVSGQKSGDSDQSYMMTAQELSLRQMGSVADMQKAHMETDGNLLRLRPEIDASTSSQDTNSCWLQAMDDNSMCSTSVSKQGQDNSILMPCSVSPSLDMRHSKDSAVGTMSPSSCHASDSQIQRLSSPDEYKFGFDKNREIYKFKNDIKLRFSADLSSTGLTTEGEDSAVPVDEECMALPPKEEDPSSGENPVKESQNSPSLDSCSTTTPYPNSDSSNGNGTSSSKAALSNPVSQEHVPGFALHTTGTYYIPVVIRTSSLVPLFKAEQNSPLPMNMLHPISIPVSFGGPCFSAMASIQANRNPVTGDNSSSGEERCSKEH